MGPVGLIPGTAGFRRSLCPDPATARLHRGDAKQEDTRAPKQLRGDANEAALGRRFELRARGWVICLEAATVS
jgi:hypothetical protein